MVRFLWRSKSQDQPSTNVDAYSSKPWNLAVNHNTIFTLRPQFFTKWFWVWRNRTGIEGPTASVHRYWLHKCHEGMQEKKQICCKQKEQWRYGFCAATYKCITNRKVDSNKVKVGWLSTHKIKLLKDEPVKLCMKKKC